MTAEKKPEGETVEEKKEVEIFKPGIAQLTELAEGYKDLVIKDANDEEGYAIVKAAKKDLADKRNRISEAGLGFRKEALDYQKEVIRQEKELLAILAPVEENLKKQLAAVDEEKKREERKELLPGRRLLLQDIELEMTDDAILQYDEKGFSDMYSTKKMEFLEKREQARLAEEAEKKRLEEIKIAEENAAAKAVEDEKNRVEKERLEKEAEDLRLKEEEDARIAQEEKDRIAEAKKLARNKKFLEWLASHGVEKGDENFKVERVGDSQTFILWKKASEITLE